MGEQPPPAAFAPSEMPLSSQSYTGQILQPTYSPDTLSYLSYADGFEDEPPLLEGKINAWTMCVVPGGAYAFLC